MPTTLRLRAETAADLAEAAAILRRGGLVAFPTETVYGLGAHALSPTAVAGIFNAKGRPAWDPLIVHVAGLSQVSEVADLHRPELRDRVETLAQAFWPGPLTLLLPRSASVPDAVTAGRALVGVRLPAHPVAQELLRLSGLPIAAPSANRFGHVSPTTAQHVLDDLDGRIDAVVDGGACQIGLESTVLDPCASPMVLYRAGAVTPEALEGVLREPVMVYHAAGTQGQDAPAALPSPGVGIRHYAPNVPLILTIPHEAALARAAERLADERRGKIGVLVPEGWTMPSNSALLALPWGSWDKPEQLATRLFAALRAMEQERVSAVVCPLPEPGGLRDALRDRLLKAARPR